MTHDETAAHLAGGLPAYYPSSPSDDNYRLMQAIAGEFDQQESDIQDAYDAGFVQRADSMAQLTELGKLIDVMPRTNESIDSYRARLLAEYALLTGTATINELISIAARILDVEKSAISYEEPSQGEYGTAQITFPNQPFNNLAFSEGDLADILDRTIPAGYRLDSIVSGTFTYITPSDYNNNLHDASKGYDGLDANGDPKDNGGTYAGLID